MSSSIHQAQDKFFKQAMTNIQVATDFFQSYFPKEILNTVDLSSLVLEKNSFVDDNFKNLEADIIYKVKINQQEGFFYLLCENQSKIDRMISFRLMAYMISLLKNYLNQNKPCLFLPIVYPMVIYSGKTQWNAPKLLYELFEKPNLAKEIFLKPYKLIDVYRIEDAKLQEQILSGIVGFALKNRIINNLEDFLQKLFPWLNKVELIAGSDFAKIILKYATDSLSMMGKKSEDMYIEKANQYLSSKLRGEAMTLADLFRAEGKEIGVKQGLQQGLQQGEYRILIHQLQIKFADIPEIYYLKLREADAKTLLYWGERIITANTLEEVFN